MKKIFAVPTINGQLCSHFGRCDSFAIVETEDNKITSEKSLTPPAHEPGSYPRFLASQGVNTIIAGGMGANAQQLFAQNSIEVCMGVAEGSPKQLVESYLSKALLTGQNQCDGGSHGHKNECHHNN